MSARPLIGISMDTLESQVLPVMYELSQTYSQCVLEAGGLPLLLPHIHEESARSQMINLLDGLLIPGGDDIDPALYGHPQHPKTQLMDQYRQSFDFAVLALAERSNLPTLGICLGCQIINVQRHGTLTQYLTEIASQPIVNHAADPDRLLRYDTRHDVTVVPETRLASIFGTPSLGVNSTHRQGIKKLGEGLSPSAFSPDGLIEAIEDPTLDFWVGVQWHPERMAGEPQIKLFRALVKAAQKHSQKGQC